MWAPKNVQLIKLESHYKKHFLWINDFFNFAHASNILNSFRQNPPVLKFNRKEIWHKNHG